MQKFLSGITFVTAGTISAGYLRLIKVPTKTNVETLFVKFLLTSEILESDMIFE